MSENEMSFGVMVPLNRQLTEEEIEEWSELLWEQGSFVKFNYEGTLAYTESRGDEYGIIFGLDPNISIGNFEEDLRQFGLSVYEELARPYVCHWYNGADSYMSTMTLKEFMKRTDQEMM